MCAHCSQKSLILVIIGEGMNMRVGFIGVGNMGGPIATHLVAAEHELRA
ncbi:MAG TPA: NAD(P)-dependent oxidoreductase, partial [Acidimicrobiia bacterium]|nr:NAD(P)-dependent oxidoreductase [Acidimicrobiia bacterium]